METIPCQRDRTHTGVWTCSCANGGNFCSLCILDHMGGDPPGQQHSVSPREPIGQYVCGRCHGQPLESVRFKYDVCLCRNCASSLTISSQAGQQHAPYEIPGMEIPEAQMKQESEASMEREAKQRAEVPPGFPREEGANRRAEGSRSMLQRMISEKRNDIHQSLRRAYDNMNSLEEIIQEALSLEVQLTESRLEVQRLQSRLAEQGGASRVEAGQMAGLQSFMEKIEAVSRENGVLKTQDLELNGQIVDLTTKLQAAERTINDQITKLEEAEGQIAELRKQHAEELIKFTQVVKKEQLDEAVKMLQDSFREQLADSAKVVTQKVTDVIPLVGHVELDNQWLDRVSTEKFLQLATLGINDWVDSERMREIARVCVQVAKHLGPNRLIAVFADNVAKKLKTNKEEGLKLVRSLYSVYEKTRSDQSSKNVIEGLLSLLEVDIVAFHDCVNILSHLGKLLNLRSVCEFATEMTKFFSQKRLDADEWKQYWLSLPVDWNQDREAAEKCVKDLLDSVKERNYDQSYLPLAQLLNSGRIADPASLFELVSKLGTNMKSAEITGHVRGLLDIIIEFVEIASRAPQQEAKSNTEACFGILNRLLKERDAKHQEIQKLTLFFATLPTNLQLANFAILFHATLQILKNADSISQFGFSTLTWIFPDDKARPNLDFALWLITLVNKSDRGTIEDTAKRAAALLSQTIGTNFEQTITKLVEKKVPFIQTCDLGLVLISDFTLGADQLNNLIDILKDVVENVAQQAAVEWVEKTTALVRGKNDLVYRAYQFYGEMKRRGQPLAETDNLGREFLAIFQTSGDPKPIRTMLDVVLKILNTDNQQYALVSKVCKFWSGCRRILPADPRNYSFSTFLLRMVEKNLTESETLLIGLESTLGIGNEGLVTIMLSLADIYVGCVNECPLEAKKFFGKTLDSLKNIRNWAQGEITNLEALTRKAIEKLDESRKAALLFLEGVYQLRQENKVAIDTYLLNLNVLLDLPEFILLVKTMSRLANFGYYLSLLTLSCQHQNAVITNTQSKLVELAIYLEQKKIEAPELSQNLSNAVLQRPAEIEELLTAMSTMLMKNNYFTYYQLAYQLLEELLRRTKEVLPLLCFILEMTTALLDIGANPQYVVKLCEVIVRELDNAEGRAVMEKLRKEWKQDWVQKVSDLLNREQDRVTLESVEELLPKMLAHVQVGSIRFFNFQNNAWENTIPLTSQIKVHKEYSQWIFLDADRVFCCGGKN